MVAIYIPVLQSAAPVYSSVAKTYKLDYKTAFILRALHACNEAKDNKITCLGNAVTYSRRCRNPLHKWTTVLAEMIEAAEDGTLYFDDLKFLAAGWAAGVSCYLHGSQKGVAMATLGAVALYRQTFPANVVVPRVTHLPLKGGVLSSIDRYVEGCLTGKKKLEALKRQAKKLNEVALVLEKSLDLVEAKHMKNPDQLKKALLLIEKAVLLLCESVLTLLLESNELLCEALCLQAEQLKLQDA